MKLMQHHITRDNYLESSLRGALEREELLLHYQPKQDLGHGGVSGVEALLRWQHPDRGLLLPKTFIPSGEQDETASIQQGFCWHIFEIAAAASANIVSRLDAWSSHKGAWHQRDVGGDDGTVMELPGGVDGSVASVQNIMATLAQRAGQGTNLSIFCFRRPAAKSPTGSRFIIS
jgi:hypothetical protein